MGPIPVVDSDFFFVPRSCHVDQFTFHCIDLAKPKRELLMFLG